MGLEKGKEIKNEALRKKTSTSWLVVFLRPSWLDDNDNSMPLSKDTRHFSRKEIAKMYEGKKSMAKVLGSYRRRHRPLV